MIEQPKITRREATTALTTAVVALSTSGQADGKIAASIIENHDAKLQRAIEAQVTDPKSQWCGASPDRRGLYHCGSAARILRDGAAALLHPASRFHGSDDLYRRMKLSADFLNRSQSRDGFIDLITTNFNSPPDTGFVCHHVATAARLAQMHQRADLVSCMQPFLVRAGRGMATGGIHTPNHRWVVCAALAQIHELFPDDRHTKRIDQWLAEGIDIDSEGQFTERSTTVYNAVSDNALVVVAHKLNRPELLDPVRKNLNAMAYLLHPSGEVVTEISRRQDLNTRGTMSRYWFSLRYMALRDNSRLYSTMLRFTEPDQIRLAALMEYPHLQKPLPATTTLPDNYVKSYPQSEVTRIRKGKTSITIMHRRNSRLISIHHGQAVINAVRLATAFFGKGQFIPESFEKRDDGFHFRQELEGPYYQPLANSNLRPVNRDNWPSTASKRQRSEINRMIYDMRIVTQNQGVELHISAHGTDGVPTSLEINLREGGELRGATDSPDGNDTFLFKDESAEYQMGTDRIRFEPGQSEHSYTEVRGALPKLPGPSLYVTGYTPFRYTLRIHLL